MAFFSSFDYLKQVSGLFAERYPDIPVWQQARGMTETEKNEFLERFADGGKASVLPFSAAPSRKALTCPVTG